MEMGESEMTPEIVPCPYCGSTRMEYEAKFRTDPVVRGDIDELILSCALCHRSYDVTDEPIIQSREEMIALWNKVVRQGVCLKCGAPTQYKDGAQRCVRCWWENPCLDEMTETHDNNPDKPPLTTK